MHTLGVLCKCRLGLWVKVNLQVLYSSGFPRDADAAGPQTARTKGLGEVSRWHQFEPPILENK